MFVYNLLILNAASILISFVYTTQSKVKKNVSVMSVFSISVRATTSMIFVASFNERIKE